MFFCFVTKHACDGLMDWQTDWQTELGSQDRTIIAALRGQNSMQTDLFYLTMTMHYMQWLEMRNTTCRVTCSRQQRHGIINKMHINTEQRCLIHTKQTMSWQAIPIHSLLSTYAMEKPQVITRHTVSIKNFDLLIFNDDRHHSAKIFHKQRIWLFHCSWPSTNTAGPIYQCYSW